MAKFVKVRMKFSMAGKLLNGTEFSAQPDQVLLLPAEDAEKWIESGHAERAAKEDAITETAALGNNDYLEHDPRLIYRLEGYRPS